MTTLHSKDPVLQATRLRLSQSELDSLMAAVNELHRISGEEYRLVKVSWGRFLGMKMAGVTLVSVSTDHRPPEGSFVGIVDKSPSMILLPTFRTEDFDKCCDLFGLDSTESREELKHFLMPPESPLRR